MLAAPDVPFTSLGSDTLRANRRTIVEGVPDYDHEFVHTGRSRNGSPGVHIFTPVRIGETTAVLVNRGWVYAADAATVDLSRWRESRGTFRGYTREMAPGALTGKVRLNGVRVLTRGALREFVPYPVDSVYVIARDSSADRTPARLPEPNLSNGPHLSYAIQWFCFAAIALTGAGIVFARARSPRRPTE